MPKRMHRKRPELSVNTHYRALQSINNSNNLSELPYETFRVDDDSKKVNHKEAQVAEATGAKSDACKASLPGGSISVPPKSPDDLLGEELASNPDSSTSGCFRRLSCFRIFNSSPHRRVHPLIDKELRSCNEAPR